MKQTLGILAHVDAGKTTLSERILYHANAIRDVGRVDDGSAHMDHSEIERERGITVFSDAATADADTAFSDIRERLSSDSFFFYVQCALCREIYAFP